MSRLTVLTAVILVFVICAAAVMADASEVEIDPDLDGKILSDKAEKALTNKVIKDHKHTNDLAAYMTYMEEQRQIEQRNREATELFGQWGPYLVDAAAIYGQDPAALHRVMTCESKGDPNADNGVNKGLFQFHPGTFAGTPYGGADIFDGPSQIYAAAWMWSQGRKGEWGCF